MSVSQPDCPLCGEADIVRKFALPGTHVAAANIETTEAVKVHGQQDSCLPVSLPKSICTDAKGIPLSLLILKSTRAPYHRAGAFLQRRNHRQQAVDSTSLSDVLFILNEESISSIITNH
jgi:hypothetical protein